MFIQSHETYMKRCLQLAAQGLGKVAPNPMVGCVIVHQNQIIAEGYHEVYGSAHAEPNAIRQVNDELLKDCTLYVTLEPCSHFGKTPPCANLIIDKGIKHVVIGNLDSNPLVSGKGVQKLRDAGINVEYGILDEECRELNKRFFTFHEQKRPYVILKWAQTLDGYISRWPLPENKTENWITGNESKQLVHNWRTQEQAILIGHNTLVADNPLLTARLAKGKNPIRMVLSKYLELDANLNVFNHDAPTVIFNTKQQETNEHTEFIKIDWNNRTQEVLNYCFQKGISSLIIEGGTQTIEQFMQTNAWDEARLFINPNQTFGNGIKAPLINLDNIIPVTVGKDWLYTLQNT